MIATMTVLLMPYSALGKAYADESETLPLTGTVGTDVIHFEDKFATTAKSSNRNVATVVLTNQADFAKLTIHCVNTGTVDITIESSQDPKETDSITCNAPTSIPEFPFPLSLVIIFVAVTAVYLGIRQKMIPGFKSF